MVHILIEQYNVFPKHIVQSFIGLVTIMPTILNLGIRRLIVRTVKVRLVKVLVLYISIQISTYHPIYITNRSWRGVLDTTLCDKIC